MFLLSKCNFKIRIYRWFRLSIWEGREPPDTMSLRYADTSLPDVLGRMQTKPPLCKPSLHYADCASAMQ